MLPEILKRQRQLHVHRTAVVARRQPRLRGRIQIVEVSDRRSHCVTISRSHSALPVKPEADAGRGLPARNSCERLKLSLVPAAPSPPGRSSKERYGGELEHGLSLALQQAFELAGAREIGNFQRKIKGRNITCGHSASGSTCLSGVEPRGIDVKSAAFPSSFFRRQMAASSRSRTPRPGMTAPMQKSMSQQT